MWLKGQKRDEEDEERGKTTCTQLMTPRQCFLACYVACKWPIKEEPYTHGQIKASNGHLARCCALRKPKKVNFAFACGTGKEKERREKCKSRHAMAFSLMTIAIQSSGEW